MGWVIFWGIIGVYLIIAIKKIPVYYKRCDEHNAKEYPHLYAARGMNKETAWETIGLAVFWPFYEVGRWIQNYVIHSATKEERKQAEYEKAAKIVEDYQKQKEREEREVFDKELGL